jgi:hypothetical protein
VQQFPSKTSPQTTDFIQTLSTLRRQWRCTDGNCEETITKCRNSLCETSLKYFKSLNYKPAPLKIEKPPIEITNQILNFTQFPETVQTLKPSAINDINTGLIDVVINSEKSISYWSNSKHVTKTCRNRICVVVTETQSCIDGKCVESKETKTEEIK